MSTRHAAVIVSRLVYQQLVITALGPKIVGTFPKNTISRKCNIFRTHKISCKAWPIKKQARCLLVSCNLAGRLGHERDCLHSMSADWGPQEVPIKQDGEHERKRDLTLLDSHEILNMFKVDESVWEWMRVWSNERDLCTLMRYHRRFVRAQTFHSQVKKIHSLDRLRRNE